MVWEGIWRGRPATDQSGARWRRAERVLSTERGLRGHKSFPMFDAESDGHFSLPPLQAAVWLDSDGWTDYAIKRKGVGICTIV